MRYIRQQRFITTISNEDITDVKDIKSLLETLYLSSITVHFVYIDKLRDATISYDVRIKQVNDLSVDIKAFKGTGSLTMRDIPFVDIVSIKLVTDTDNIMIGDGKTSKFDLLDIEIDENNK